jgi:regulator of protease activity HflC (stomatin/prohibitin superfamily)
MAARRKKKKSGNSGFRSLLCLVVLPLMAANLYASWKVFKVAEWMEVPVFGSFHNGPAQLASLLLINTGLLAVLVIIKE